MGKKGRTFKPELILLCVMSQSKSPYCRSTRIFDANRPSSSLTFSLLFVQLFFRGSACVFREEKAVVWCSREIKGRSVIFAPVCLLRWYALSILSGYMVVFVRIDEATVIRSCGIGVRGFGTSAFLDGYTFDLEEFLVAAAYITIQQPPLSRPLEPPVAPPCGLYGSSFLSTLPQTLGTM